MVPVDRQGTSEAGWPESWLPRSANKDVRVRGVNVYGEHFVDAQASGVKALEKECRRWNVLRPKSTKAGEREKRRHPRRTSRRESTKSPGESPHVDKCGG